MVRTCCQCGSEFEPTSRQLKCPRCKTPARDPHELSFREKQIAHLVKTGRMNKEIAHELHLSEGTIKEYMNRIFRKLGLKSRTELAVWTMSNLPA